MINHKFNTRNTLRAGLIYSRLSFDITGEGMDWDIDVPRYVTLINADGQSYTVQAYSQWQQRLTTDLDFNTGAHFIYFGLNGKNSLEPRASLKWRFLPGQSLSYGIGIHSRVEVLSVYLAEVPSYNNSSTITNKNVGFSKALHNVLGYDLLVNQDMRIKIETYYQYLFNVAQPVDPQSKQSGVNFMNGLVDIELNNGGKGYNCGLEITLEKFYTSNYYYLFTASLYDSKYTAPDGNIYNSVFNGNYIFNVLGGKEFEFKNNSTLTANGKLIIKGGNRTTPLDINQSIIENRSVYQEDKYLEEKVKDFIRMDISATYRKNHKKFSWELSLDIQNVTDRQNIFNSYWDDERHKVMDTCFPGLLPIINFRLVF
jgi:hypothetical protein